jgi:hypothetical protein
MSGRAATSLPRESPGPCGADQAGGETETLDRKCGWILSRELEYAHRVALRLVDKPELSVWMILIPIIFLHFMYRAQKFKAGLGAITRELLASREFALALARESLVAGTEAPDPAKRFPDGAGTLMDAPLREAEIQLSRVLIGHYRRLLEARGESYEELVRNAYGNEGRYREEFLRQLVEAEERIAACAREAAEDIPEALQTLTRMKAARHELREGDVKLCFTPGQPAQSPGRR